MDLKCIECWKDFTTINNRQRCCSKECQKEHAKKVRKLNDSKLVEHVCEICWTTFIWLKRRNMCDNCLSNLRSSNTCNFDREDIEKICLNCWKVFTSKSKNAEYCSSKCYQRARYLNVTKKTTYNHVCILCWKQFTNNRKDSTRCSDCVHIKTDKQIEVSKESYKKMIDIIWVDNPSHLEWVQEKREETCLKNNWVRFPTQDKKFILKAEETKLKKTWYRYTSQIPWKMDEIISKIRKTNEARWYWPITNAELPWVKEANKQISKANKKIWEKLKKEWHEVQLEFRLPWYNWRNKYWDILVDWKIILEYDPWNTHNTEYVIAWNIFHKVEWEEKKKRMNAQLEKTIVAERNWYRCIHIFSWDNLNKILDMISLNKRKIYARKCNVVMFTNKSDPEKYLEISNLIEEAHLQWQLKSNNWKVVTCVALEYKWEIVATMTFWPDRNKKDSNARECYRLCTKKWNMVIWWSKKMRNHFIKNINPECVISFCDKAHFSWKVYYELWMELECEYEPRRMWCLWRIKDIRNEYEEIYKEFSWDDSFQFNWKELAKTRSFIADNYMTWAWQRWFLWFDWATKWLIWKWWKWTKNIELAKLAWYVPVYDCWQMKFVRRRPTSSCN